MGNPLIDTESTAYFTHKVTFHKAKIFDSIMAMQSFCKVEIYFFHVGTSDKHGNRRVVCPKSYFSDSKHILLQYGHTVGIL